MTGSLGAECDTDAIAGPVQAQRAAEAVLAAIARDLLTPSWPAYPMYSHITGLGPQAQGGLS